MANVLCASILKNYAHLYKQSELADIVVVVNGESIPAHRIILAAQSEYFKDLLYHTNGTPKADKEVHLEAGLTSFKLLLKYMYTGQLGLQEETLEDLVDVLDLTERFSFGQLKTLIEKHFISKLNWGTLESFLDIAFMFKMSKLKTKCWPLVEMAVEGYPKKIDFSSEILLELFHFRARVIPDVKLVQELTKHDLTIAEKLQAVAQIRYAALGKQDEQQLKQMSFFVNRHEHNDVQNINAGKNPKGKIKSLPEKTSFSLFKDSTTNEKLLEIDLAKKYAFNQIHFNMTTVGSYYVEISCDRSTWMRVADFSSYPCRRKQKVYFREKLARYIRIAGVSHRKNEEFQIRAIEVLHEADEPECYRGQLVSRWNVITNSVAVFYGVNGLTGESFDVVACSASIGDGRYIFHTITNNKPSYFVFKLDQPTVLSACRVHLWDREGQRQSFNIKVDSPGVAEQEIIYDSKELVDGRQIITFNPRPVSRFIIQGTGTTFKDEFRMVRFDTGLEPEVIKRNQDVEVTLGKAASGLLRRGQEYCQRYARHIFSNDEEEDLDFD